MLLITHMRDNAVNIIATAELTESTPVDSCAATTACFQLIAMYVPQAWVFTHTTDHLNCHGRLMHM